MQRVGRINRVGTTFEKIHVFNFFPTTKSNEHLSLKDNIINKIQAFHNTFGEDSKFLTEDEEVESYKFSGEKLYEELNKNLNIEEESFDDTELEYLKVIREVRDNNEKLFKKIKELPKKSRSGRVSPIEKESVISFIKDGELKRIYISDTDFQAKELTFFNGVKILKCTEEEKRINIKDNFYDMLASNKENFRIFKSGSFSETMVKKKAGNDAKINKIIKALEGYSSKFGRKEEEQLSKIKELIENGYLPKELIKDINSEIEKVMKTEPNPHKILQIFYETIPDKYKQVENKLVDSTTGNIEVILSEYLG